MEVREIEQHEDGSATYQFDMTEDERVICTQQGITWMIVAGITGVTPEKVLQDHLDKEEAKTALNELAKQAQDMGVE
jgi:hypothetical protein